MIVIGVGNRYRSDDGVGPACTARLSEMLGPGMRVIEQSGDAGQLLDVLVGAEEAILIDAVRSGAAPGSIVRLDASKDALPRELFPASTHSFGVVEAVEIARSLGKLPRRLIVYGVEGVNFSAGTDLTPEVERAIPELVERVMEECSGSDDPA